jgi:hypothetical protein
MSSKENANSIDVKKKIIDGVNAGIHYNAIQVQYNLST